MGSPVVSRPRWTMYPVIMTGSVLSLMAADNLPPHPQTCRPPPYPHPSQAAVSEKSYMSLGFRSSIVQTSTTPSFLANPRIHSRLARSTPLSHTVSCQCLVVVLSCRPLPYCPAASCHLPRLVLVDADLVGAPIRRCANASEKPNPTVELCEQIGSCPCGSVAPICQRKRNSILGTRFSCCWAYDGRLATAAFCAGRLLPMTARRNPCACLVSCIFNARPCSNSDGAPQPNDEGRCS